MCIECVSRRQFLGVSAASAAAIFSGSTTAFGQSNKHYRKIDYTTYRIRREPNNPNNLRTIVFSPDEKKRLKDALTIVADRFHRPDILATVLKKCGAFWFYGLTSDSRKLARVPTNVNGWRRSDIERFIRFQFLGLREAFQNCTLSRG